MGLHTPGRNGPYHPPLHLIATRGGCDGQGQCWAPLPSWPSALLRRTWPWYLRRRVRQPLKTEAVNRLGEACFTKAPHGLVTNVPRGAVPAGAQSVARYVAP
jgi:hypothetical protein